MQIAESSSNGSNVLTYAAIAAIVITFWIGVAFLVVHCNLL